MARRRRRRQPSPRALGSSKVAAGQNARQRAYALDAISEAALFTVSPLLVAGVVGLSHPLLALALTALITLTGGLGTQHRCSSGRCGTAMRVRPHLGVAGVSPNTV